MQKYIMRILCFGSSFGTGSFFVHIDGEDCV